MSNTDTSRNSDCTYDTNYTSENNHRRRRRKCDSRCSDESYTNTRDCSYESSDNKYSNDSCDGKRRRHRRQCSDDCIKHSDTPVGVWNLIFQYENVTTTATTTTDTTLERPSQLLMNEGGTFSNHSSPDLNNNPFGDLLTTGVGVWHAVGERKLKLEATHIAYKASNGSPTTYYKVYIIMKLNRRGTKSRFYGQAVPKDLIDTVLCTDSSLPVICFNGCGYKVLEPKR